MTADEVARIARSYHAWRGEPDAVEYRDRPGFCTTATPEEIAAHDYVPTPSCYVGTSEVEDDGEPLEEKLARLVATLDQQVTESARLAETIRANLWRLHGVG